MTKSTGCLLSRYAGQREMECARCDAASRGASSGPVEAGNVGRSGKRRAAGQFDCSGSWTVPISPQTAQTFLFRRIPCTRRR